MKNKTDSKKTINKEILKYFDVKISNHPEKVGLIVTISVSNQTSLTVLNPLSKQRNISVYIEDEKYINYYISHMVRTLMNNLFKNDEKE